MPNIDASIPLSYKPVDALSTLGSIASTANALTSVKRSQIGLEQEQGQLDARKAIGALMGDPNLRDPDTGLPDLNKFAVAAQAADKNGYFWPQAIKAQAEANNELMKVRANVMSLGDQQMDYVGKRTGAAALDPENNKEKTGFMLDDIQRIAPAARPMVDIVRKHLAVIPDDPKALNAYLTRVRNMGFPMAAQQPQVAGIGTGADTQFAQTNPLAGQVGPVAGSQPIPNAVGPTGAETSKSDVLGNPYIETKSPAGQIVPKAMPGANTPPLLSFPPGETPQTAAALSAGRNAANDAARTIPEQHFNNAQIVKLADATTTGEGAKMAAMLKGGAAGIPWTADSASNFNRLGHFIALQAQTNAKAMGAGTDAARALSEQATVSTNWTADAIKSAAKINDALASGVDYFNRGLEKAINDPSNQKSIFAAREFQNAWAQNFDVTAMRLLNAKESGNNDEVRKIIGEIGGKNSPPAKALAQKVRNLDALINQGRM